MPSLIEAIRQQAENIKKGKRTEFSFQGSIESDVRDAENTQNTDTFSRIANHIPYYFNKQEEKTLFKQYASVLESIGFVPTKFGKDEAKTSDVQKLLEASIFAVEQSNAVEKLVEQQKRGIQLTEKEQDFVNSPPANAASYLRVSPEGLQKMREFYLELIKQTASQVLKFDSKTNDYVLDPDFVNEMKLQKLLAILDAKKTKELVSAIILSITNNVLIPFLSKFKKAYADKNTEMEARYLIALQDINVLAANREFKELDKLLGASLPVEYVMKYINECKHDEEMLKKIMSDPFYGKEISEFDTVKHRHQLVKFFSKTDKQHELGDRIFSYVKEHYPGLPAQIQNNVLRYKNDDQKQNQFVYALKALVRLDRPDLAYEALYGKKAPTQDKKELRKAVKEKVIRAYLKQENKQEVDAVKTIGTPRKVT